MKNKLNLANRGASLIINISCATAWDYVLLALNRDSTGD